MPEVEVCVDWHRPKTNYGLGILKIRVYKEYMEENEMF